MTDPTQNRKPDQPNTPAETVDGLWQKLDLAPDAFEEQRSPWGLRLFLAVLVIVSLAGLGYVYWVRPVLKQPLPTPAVAAVDPEGTPAPTLAATATPSAPTPAPGVPRTGQADTLPLSPTPTPIGQTALTPPPQAVGWASSLDGRAHFDDPNIHVGLLQGHVYYGAIQFDLSALPANALITSAVLELTGLGGQQLGPGGVWQVRLLDEAIDETWPDLSYDLLQEARVDINILPALTSQALGRGEVNLFTFGPEQLAALQSRLPNRVVSFRLDGPTSGGDNFFTWDSGYRGQQQSDAIPVLRIVAVSRQYVVITSTPTPENVFTAIAQLDPTTQALSDLRTPTPLPPHWVTPLVVTPRPPPANAATAGYEEQLVTAEAILYGTATPTPLNIWTATPTSVSNVVTSTPTPENVVTAAAIAAQATQIAQTIGTYTPVPGNWITPVVVTPIPAPANAATAEHYAAVATAQAYLGGPGGAVWTVTPTPIFGQPTVFPTYTPTPGYTSVPQALVGKIAFLSDRAGDPYDTGQDPLVYVMDPATGSVVPLSNRSAYNTALLRDHFSADLRFRAYTEDFLRFDGERVPGLYFYDEHYEVSEQMTQFGAGIAYDPAWSPAREQIAFIGTETGNDDIWVINRDGSGLLQLTTDINWDKSPSWSPDGSQIIFWSNRTGSAQVWIMNPDGSNQRILNPSPYNDWNPVWVKYTGLPPLVPELVPTRPPVFIEFN